MPENAMVGDGECGDAPDAEPTVSDIPCPHCGRPTTWVQRDQGTFHSIEQLRADCGCDLTDDEWLDLGDEARARLGERLGPTA